MKRLPILIALLIAGVFLASNTMGNSGPKTPPSKYEKILQIVGEILTQGHFKPKDINDEFSSKVYEKYFEELDPEKNIFRKEDLVALNKYATKIDDEIKGAPVQFFLDASKLFDKRATEASLLYKDILSKPFDFSVSESITTDAEKISFANSAAEQKEAWRKRLKYLALQRYSDLLDARESNKGKDGFVVKSDADLEKEAREKVKVAMDRIFDRYRVKFNEDEKFAVFVNTITNLMDPYTEFFPPVDKRYFDEQLSGSFYGIGAQLQYDEGNIKVASVLPGGPAQKSGEVEVGDVIIKVAQGKTAAAVDLAGYDVQDAVKIIRGQKGTEVTLTIRKKGGSLKTLSLIREKIEQDESYVRSAVINQGTSKVGYIYLPEFYANFDDPNDAHRSSLDVAKEVKKLKDEKVDGIVLDLRNNGGGSLYDVIQIVGLFIDQGPVVQVKDRESQPQIMRDRDGGVLYDGPLTVMVNEFSASASEILAAAIQDYGRGVIIGSTSTYGKGTVQRSIGLDPSNISSSNSDLGSLKLTLQKFYRINGGSTQQKGVVPDVVVPDYYEYLKFRERDNKSSLPYDEISKAAYTPWQPGYSLQTVKTLANTRIASDSVFRLIKEKTELLDKNDDKMYSLQLDQFRKEQKANREAVREIEKLVKMKQTLDIAYLKQDEQRYNSADKDKNERYKQWLTGISKDVYVDQAVKVVNDIVTQQNLAKGKQPSKTF